MYITLQIVEQNKQPKALTGCYFTETHRINCGIRQNRKPKRSAANVPAELPVHLWTVQHIVLAAGKEPIQYKACGFNVVAY